jgi:O-antigen/teichoic acid export membrane protein
VWALVYAQVAGAAITSALSFMMVPGRVRLRFDPKIARELYRYGRFITALAIVVFLTRELDNALVGKLLGMETLGYYVVAYSLATIPVDFLSRFLAKVFFPMFSKLQKDVGGLRSEYLRAIRLITALMVPLCVAVVVLAPEIVQTLYGARWAQTVGPLRVLAVFGCFRALWLLNGYLYNAIGKPYVDFYTNLTRLLVMGTLLFPLTLRYGLVGAAIAVAAPMGAQFALGLFLSRRFIGVPVLATLRPLASSLAHGLVLALVLIAAKSMISADPLIGLVCLTALGGAVCLALNLRDIRTLLAAAGAR